MAAVMRTSARAGLLNKAIQRAPVAGVRLVGLPARRALPVCQAYKNDQVDTEDVNRKFNDAVSNTGAYLQTKWEETEDKPAAVIITAGAILLLVTLSSVVDAVDKIPIFSDLIELVGVAVTAWFTYRYLVFGPDREELVNNIKSFLRKVYGAN